MFPIKDNIPSRTTPFVNYAILLVCSLVFLLQLREVEGEPALVERYGLIPARVLHPDEPVEVMESALVMTRRGPVLQEIVREAAPAAVPVWWTLLTCIFLHGGWMHFLGNMWFLWIFGDNVEDRFGHVRFLLFYLGCGALASLAHLLAGPESTLPTIGASGAIAGVMGAYFLLYPHAKVLAVLPIFFFIQVLVVPAPLFLGLWFVLQLVSGSFVVDDVAAGGVAWWAHIGGFVAGVALAWLLGRMHRLNPPVTAVRPHTERLGAYRYAPRRRS